jgi:inosine-uridine nucleoside N-ribohydrolase
MKQVPSRRGFIAGAAGFAMAAQAATDIPLPSGKVRMVLDTDTYNEIDDQYAVAYALLAPEAMTVEALYAAPYLNSRSTSAGEGMEKSYEEIHRVLDRLGKKGTTKVFKGSSRFMKDGDGPVDSPAARDLIERAMASNEMLYVATVGAPTNVASAILMEPKIKEKITVVWLGGRPPHFPTAHEFNLQQDPPSSQVFFDSGVPLMVAPTTNVTEMLRTTTAELAQFIKGKSKIGDYLYEIFVEYAKEHKRDFSKPWSKVIWDISAIAWLIEPKWIDSKLISSPLLADDLRWGATQGRHKIRVATHINRDAIFGDLFARLVKA